MRKVKIIEIQGYGCYECSHLFILKDTDWDEVDDETFVRLCKWASDKTRKLKWNYEKHAIVIATPSGLTVPQAVSEYTQMMQEEQEQMRKAREEAEKRKLEKQRRRTAKQKEKNTKSELELLAELKKKYEDK